MEALGLAFFLLGGAVIMAIVLWYGDRISGTEVRDELWNAKLNARIYGDDHFVDDVLADDPIMGLDEDRQRRLNE